MTFRILFMYAYGLAQLYVVCLRRTVTPSVMAYLFLVGALTCIPVTYFTQSLLSHYFAQSATMKVVHSGVEEVIKVLPLLYLFFRTRVGQYAGLLDGILCGAALGAGFGFAEDTIYAIENAALPAPYPSWAGIVFSWLPGGWNRYGAFFPGHAVLGALAGGGIAAARRFAMPLAVRVLVCAVAIGWAVLLHAAFNTPDALWPWVVKYVFGWLNGSGAYAKYYVMAAIVIFLIVEECAQARWSRDRRVNDFAPAVRPAGLFSELSAWFAALANGWQPALKSARVLRLKRELFNLDTGGGPEAARLAQIRRVELEAAAAPVTAKPWMGAARRMQGAITLRPVQDFIYFWLLLVVMAMGFYLVFISPFLAHATAQQIGRTTTFLAIGALGQVLVAWRCIDYLLRRRPEPGPGTDAGVKHVARYLLAWGGLITNAIAWKSLYDGRSFPYPFRPADVEATVNQYRYCYGAVPASASAGPLTSPIPPAIGPGRPQPQPDRPQPQPATEEPTSGAADPGLGDGGSGAETTPPPKPIKVGGADEDFGGGDADPGLPPPPVPPRASPRPLPTGPLGDPADLPDSGNNPR